MKKKLFPILVVAFLFFSAVVAVEQYSAKYDNVDVDKILANRRQRESYYKCFAGIGPCLTADAKFFKESLPEAIVTQCKICTEKQAENFDKITDWYTTNEPEKYKAIVAKAVQDLKAKSARS